MGFAHGAQQPDGNHVEDVPLPGGQGGKVSTGDLRRGNDGVVVGHFAAVYHLGSVYRWRRFFYDQGPHSGGGGLEGDRKGVPFHAEAESRGTGPISAACTGRGWPTMKDSAPATVAQRAGRPSAISSVR